MHLIYCRIYCQRGHPCCSSQTRMTPQMHFGSTDCQQASSGLAHYINTQHSFTRQAKSSLHEQMHSWLGHRCFSKPQHEFVCLLDAPHKGVQPAVSSARHPPGCNMHAAPRQIGCREFSPSACPPSSASQGSCSPTSACTATDYMPVDHRTNFKTCSID